MNITTEQLAKYTAIIYAGVMNAIDCPLNRKEFQEMYKASLDDINQQIKNKKGVVDIDAMYEEFKQCL